MKPIMLFITSVLFTVIMLFTSCVHVNHNNIPISRTLKEEGLPPKVEPWEDGLRTDPQNKEFEWWYFDFSFNDGSTAVIFFSTKSFLNPGGKPDPEVKLVITEPDGNKITVDSKPERRDFYASKERLDIKMGNNYAKGDLDGCIVHFDDKGVSMDIKLTSKAPPWRPGTGIERYGTNKGRYFAWLPSIPYGTAEGTLTYNGRTTAVSGTGYHDHNWGNVRLDKVKSQWYWGRARIGEYTLIFSEMFTTNKYGNIRIPVFYLARGNKILSKDEYDFKFTPSQWTRHSGGRDYPRKIVINVSQDNMTAGLTISNPVIIEAQPLLDAAPWIVRVLARPFTNPYYFRFNADFTLTATNEDGEKVKETGKGIFEMMLLRGLQTVR